jgi:hypothetical protein
MSCHQQKYPILIGQHWSFDDIFWRGLCWRPGGAKLQKNHHIQKQVDKPPPPKQTSPLNLQTFASPTFSPTDTSSYLQELYFLYSSHNSHHHVVARSVFSLPSSTLRYYSVPLLIFPLPLHRLVSSSPPPNTSPPTSKTITFKPDEKKLTFCPLQ